MVAGRLAAVIAVLMASSCGDDADGDVCDVVANATFSLVAPEAAGTFSDGTPAESSSPLTFNDDGSRRWVVWTVTDMVWKMPYSCAGWTLTASQPGVTFVAKYHPDTGLLTWDGLDYRKVVR
jgi:hypothetical protein